MVEDFFTGAAETVRATDYQDACPIATVALEVASTNETLRTACADVFTSWIDAATNRFAAAGIDRERSRHLALAMLSALEGAFVLSRTLRDTAALDAAGAAMAQETRRAPVRPPVGRWYSSPPASTLSRMRRLGGTVLRCGRIAVVTLVAAAVGPAAASAQTSAPYVDWPSVLPALPAPFTPNLEPDCKDGSDSCIERTIVEMQRRFDNVVGVCSHNAVFSLAYTRVTEDVRDASKAGLFKDRVWLAQEDAVFARMYFESYDRWAAGKRDGLPQAWLLAFDAARDRKVTALGNFLMAMNAHINRDFPFLLAAIGITTPDGKTRKPDHDAYNQRLAALYAPVLKEVAERFDPTADDVEVGPVDDEAAYAILQSWREGVWRNAERLVLAPNADARAQVAREIEWYAAGHRPDAADDDGDRPGRA